MSHSRRDFLRTTTCALGSFALASTIENFGVVHALTPQAASDYKALVMVFLNGGNDGNQMFLDLGQYSAYAAQRDASQEVRESEARATRLVEQARHQATELTNAARAEVEQTLEWARAQAATIMARAQQGAEQFLASAGLGESEIARVAESIVRAADHESGGGRQPGSMPSTEPDNPQPSGPIPVRPSSRWHCCGARYFPSARNYGRRVSSSSQSASP